MIKVLHELGNLDGGGVARLLFDYYSRIDRSKVHFDFLIQDYYKEGILEQPLRELGARIFKICRVEADKGRFQSELDRVIAEGGYDIVHSHRGPQSFYALSSAKKHGVKIRIAHSHLAFRSPSAVRRIKDRALLKADKLYATDLFACGIDAGAAMWGRGAVKNGRVKIMTNAVDTEKFAFSEEVRLQKRRELDVENNFVIGTVGRIEEQKNYPFLLEVYKEALKTRPDSVLVIAGRGSLEEKIKKLARDFEIYDRVKFLGVRDDVHELINAFDVFALPSLYEGLPVVLVEAQTNGLPEVVADTVTKEMAVTDLVTFLPLDNPSLWSKTLLESSVNGRIGYREIVEKNGYGIETQAKKLEAFYLSRVKEK